VRPATCAVRPVAVGTAATVTVRVADVEPVCVVPVGTNVAV
jgi:hypothetical protein